MQMKNLLCKTLLAAAGATLITQAAQAGTVTYTGEDLMLGFQTVSGSPPSVTGNNNLLIDIGQASLYYQATSPFFVGTQAGTGSGFTLNDLNTVMGSANSQSWAVAGAVRLGDPSNPGGLANNTLFLSKARPDAITQSTPYNITGSQSGASGKVASIGNNYTGSSSLSDSASAIQQTAGSLTSYSRYMGPGGNLTGSFPTSGGGDVQQVTPGTFSSGGDSFADLYSVNGSGTFLGYFDMHNDGAGNLSLEFIPVPEPSTYGLVAGAGLLALCLRNQLRRKQA
jgi:hypothetical protein